MADNIRDETVLKTIKAINERLAVYERQGLTDSANYQKIIERIKLEKLPTTTSKSGNLRISRAKSAISEIDYKSLQRTAKIESLKGERQRLKAKGIKTKSEQDKQIINYGKLKKWADEHLDDLYDDMLSGLEEAGKLYDAFKDGLRTLDYDTIFAMIDKYEKAKQARDERLKGSKWSPKENDDIHGDYNDYFE